MDRRARGSPVLQVTLMLAAALMLMPLVRGVTIGLNHSLGRMRPFTLAHCVSRHTPGCDTEPRPHADGIVAAPSTPPSR